MDSPILLATIQRAVGVDPLLISTKSLEGLVMTSCARIGCAGELPSGAPPGAALGASSPRARLRASPPAAGQRELTIWSSTLIRNFNKSILVVGVFLSALCTSGAAAADVVSPSVAAPSGANSEFKAVTLTPIPSEDQHVMPFGHDIIPVTSGEVLERWRQISTTITAELQVTGSCQVSSTCPPAAQELLKIAAEGRDRDGLARVGVINRAINLGVVPTSDMTQWGVSDHWSPPFETLSTGRGDCEDYAIAKYAALLMLGVPKEDVKIILAWLPSVDEGHAVVVVWVNRHWTILENRWLALVRDSEVRGLSPLYSLDQNGVGRFVRRPPSLRWTHVRHSGERESFRSRSERPPPS
jgi:predicted transglutaminase-like cysteine proteinase